MSKSIEDRLKTELNIKWVAAKSLIEKAKEGLGDDVSDEEEIVDECIDLFEELSPEEQAEMKVQTNIEEPEWKRKAREQAEQREREYEERMQMLAQQQQEVVEETPEDVTTTTTSGTLNASPPRRKVKTEVTKIKYVDGKAIKEVVIEEREVGEPTKVTTVNCCVLL